MPRMVMPGAAYCVAACLAVLTLQGAAQDINGLRIDPAGAPRSDAGNSMRFDIAPQSLQSALDAFDMATGFSGLYSADAVASRRSAAVQGNFTAAAALRKMLEQSGLSSYFTAPDAYVLEQDATETGIAAAPLQAQAHDFEAILQSGVRAAFCRNALIVPGNYRIAISLRVAADGRVEQARLLDTTGNKARDGEILKTLRGVKLAHGPLNPAEAFVMLILPHAPDSTADCGASS